MRGGDVEKCTNVLVNTGSQRSTEPDCDYHRQFKKDGIEYELHWMVKGSQYSSQTIKTFMKDIIDTSVFRSGMNMPDDFHHGLVLLLHMISHITEGGLGLRQLCDWAVYVNQVDLSAWKNRYEECGLWTFACAVTAACDRYLGSGPISASHDGQISVGSPTVPTIHEWCADVPVSVCKDFIEEILQAGNFGRRNRVSYANLFLGDMSRPDQLSKRSRIRNALSHISRVCYGYYPFMETWKILLPAGWLIVGIRYLYRVAAGKREKISGTQLREVKRKERLYKELHLFESDKH